MGMVIQSLLKLIQLCSHRLLNQVPRMARSSHERPGGRGVCGLQLRREPQSESPGGIRGTGCSRSCDSCFLIRLVVSCDGDGSDDSDGDSFGDGEGGGDSFGDSGG